jgi:hypothetical protein
MKGLQKLGPGADAAKEVAVSANSPIPLLITNLLIMLLCASDTASDDGRATQTDDVA